MTSFGAGRPPLLEYQGYEASRSRPNIVVDGSPNESTVLNLTHWPGYPVDDGLGGDLSADIAFNYLDRIIAGNTEPAAQTVTTNHFDQDGLVSIHALTRPEESLPHRELLCDLAGAGDFAVYRDRRAARASMVFSRLAEQEMVGDYGSFTDMLYLEALPMVVPVLVDPGRYRELWAEEDEELTKAEEAIADRRIIFDHHSDVDLAVVHIPEDFSSEGGHRFGGERFADVHPMAINNVVSEFRILLVRGRRYRFIDRYETWVQYQSRRPMPRVDLRPLAEVLSSLERRPVNWTADGPGSLTPELRHRSESSLNPDEVVPIVISHLRSQPPAWDPYVRH